MAESHTKAQNALKTLEETQQTLRRTHNEREQTVRVKDQAIRDRDLAIERHLKQVVELELTIVQVWALGLGRKGSAEDPCKPHPPPPLPPILTLVSCWCSQPSTHTAQRGRPTWVRGKTE